MMSCKICGNRMEKYFDKVFDDRYGYPKYFDILTCAHCGLFQTYPPLQKEEIADLYTHYYTREDIDPKKIGDDFLPESGFISAARRWFTGNHRIHYDLPVATKKILEIGCGDGRSLLQLKAMGYDAHGIETDEHVRKVKDELNLPIHIGTIEDADFGEKQFDYIIANQLIEHIIDLDSFLERCKKLLKDDGLIIFSTPNAGSMYRKLCGKKWINWHIPYHQQVFTEKSLSLLLKKHGFDTVRTKIVTPMTWTLHQLHALRTSQIIGVRNPYWNREASDSASGKQALSSREKAIRALKRLRYGIVVFCINIFNRVIDTFRQGDCLIITIKKSS